MVTAARKSAFFRALHYPLRARPAEVELGYLTGKRQPSYLSSAPHLFLVLFWRKVLPAGHRVISFFLAVPRLIFRPGAAPGRPGARNRCFFKGF